MLDHCLDTLRQFVQCKADVALLTYDWIPGYRRPWPNFSVQHECRNWNTIDQWAADHYLDIDDQVSVVHPQLGKL